MAGKRQPNHSLRRALGENTKRGEKLNAMANDFLDNRQSYQVAKKPYKKGGIYFTRDGERVRYKFSCGKFDWFVWADKPNPDGEFFVSWFYEKKPPEAGCSLHPVHGWIVHA